MASSRKPKGRKKRGTTTADWRHLLMSLYPGLQTSTICVPPVIINRVPYSRDKVAGQPVLVLQQPTGGALPPSLAQSAQSGYDTQASESSETSSQSDQGAARLHTQLETLAEPIRTMFMDFTLSDVFDLFPSAVFESVFLSAHTTKDKATRPSPSENSQPLSLAKLGTVAQITSSSSVSQSTQNPPQNSSTPAALWTSDPNRTVDPKPVYDSDVRDDFSQQFLLTNLQELGNSRHEVMLILSQLSFTSYLNQSSYAAAAKRLPRPADLGNQYGDGDFDILLIHRQHGILIGEVKSVGMMHGELQNTQAQTDADVNKRVWRAIKQLDRSETVVRHLVHDIAPGVMVRKAVILPFVESAQLLRILSADQALNQAVCTCVGATNETEATALCVCSDQLSDPATYWKVTQFDLSKLTTWWQQRMACAVDNTLSDVIYLDIVARFAGPATSMTIQCTVPPRLQIPTAGDAVSFVGDTLTRLVLTPQQVDILNRAPPRVYIKGPPGTGKTVMLVMMGLRWLLQGHDVYVMCTGIENLAVSELLCHQLRTSLSLSAPQSSSPVGNVHLIAIDLGIDMVEQTKKLFAFMELLLTKGGIHHFIIDELRMGKGVPFVPTWKVNPACWLLEKWSGNHCIWMAGVYNYGMPPSVEDVVLTTPLRCAPPVQREIQPAVDDWARSDKVHPYDSTGIPSPSDGVRVIRLPHQGTDHTSYWPVDCERCGHDIAEVLRQLNVGGKGNVSTPNCAAPLQFRDVFVLTRSSTLEDDVTDDMGNVITAASGVVRGLRAAGLPIYVLGASAESDYKNRREAVADIALARSDRVTVSFSMFVQGLERKVVVWLPGENHLNIEDVKSPSETLDRIHALSRCTTQLVVLELPKPVEADLD